MKELLGLGPDISKVRTHLKENLEIAETKAFTAYLVDEALESLKKTLKNEEGEELFGLEVILGFFFGGAMALFLKKEIFTALRKICKNPFAINQFHIWLIELIYSLENEEGHPYVDYLLKLNLRKNEFALKEMVELLREKGERAAVARYFRIFKDATPDDDNYDLFFAFTLRQTPVQQVDRFLKEKQADNPIDFHEFLQLLLIDFEDLIPPKILKAVQLWLDKQEEIQETPQPEPEAQAPALPPGYVRIKGKLTDDQIRHFFSFLYKETNGSPDGEPFLKEEEVKRLLKYGFAYPVKEPEVKAFSLRLNNSKTEGMIYYCLFHLYQAHYSPAYGSNEYKRQFAYFLKHHFEGFDQSVESLTKAIRGRKRGRMRFDIEGYLPGR